MRPAADVTGSATGPDEDDVGLAHAAPHPGDSVAGVALERDEAAILDARLQQPDVAVGAEVGAVAPVVGDDVARPRVRCRDDLQPVLAGLRGVDPAGDRGPAGTGHVVAGLLQRPRHEARTPRAAAGSACGGEVLV